MCWFRSSAEHVLRVARGVGHGRASCGPVPRARRLTRGVPVVREEGRERRFVSQNASDSSRLVRRDLGGDHPATPLARGRTCALAQPPEGRASSTCVAHRAVVHEVVRRGSTFVRRDALEVSAPSTRRDVSDGTSPTRRAARRGAAPTSAARHSESARRTRSNVSASTAWSAPSRSRAPCTTCA